MMYTRGERLKRLIDLREDLDDLANTYKNVPSSLDAKKAEKCKKESDWVDEMQELVNKGILIWLES